MILYLVRHGETAYNRDGRGLGRSDIPLTEAGEQQAAALGARLATTRLDRIFTSPLLRARQTARAIAGERQIAMEPREELTEMDVGETDGLTMAEMRPRYPDFLRRWAGEECAAVRMPGGESLEDVRARLRPLMEELQVLSSAADATIAIVSHNFTLKVLFCELLRVELAKFRSFTLDLASLSTVVLREGRVSVRALNDRCHLMSLNLDPAERSF